MSNYKKKKSKLISNSKKILNSANENAEFGQFLGIFEKRRNIKDTWEFRN